MNNVVATILPVAVFHVDNIAYRIVFDKLSPTRLQEQYRERK